MGVNAILTFNTDDEIGNRQCIFNLDLPVSVDDKSAVQFMHDNFFPRVVARCRVLGRNPADLIKISTASDWDVYAQKTGQPALPELGHSCSWHFGCGREDLCQWEVQLMAEYGFGQAADMSWVEEARKELMLRLQKAQV